MISGTTRFVEDIGNTAFVPVRIQGFNGQSIEHEAIIDTGFSGTVSIRPEDATALGLLISTTVESILADGSVKVIPSYFAVVEWDGIQKLVEVVADDDVPLVGMELLTGYNLSIDVVDGGAVQITRLP